MNYSYSNLFIFQTPIIAQISKIKWSKIYFHYQRFVSCYVNPLPAPGIVEWLIALCYSGSLCSDMVVYPDRTQVLPELRSHTSSEQHDACIMGIHRYVVQAMHYQVHKGILKASIPWKMHNYIPFTSRVRTRWLCITDTMHHHASVK